jgi:hypothetical protein
VCHFSGKKIKPVNVIMSIFWRSMVFKEVVCKQRNGGRILIAFNTNNRLTVTKPAPTESAAKISQTASYKHVFLISKALEV